MRGRHPFPQASWDTYPELEAPLESFPELRELSLEEEATGGAPPQGVSRGSREYVAWVQRALNQVLGLRLATDGIMGLQTRSAIRSFQQRQGLKVDGSIGPATEQRLRLAAGISLLSATPKVSIARTTLSAMPCPPASVCVPCAPPGSPFEVLDHFGFDQAALNRTLHVSKIDRIASQVASSQSTSQPIRTILLAGHTDPVGTDDYNFLLSRRRAETAAGELCRAIDSKRSGLSRTLQFRIAACGETQTKATAELSRRVEVFLSTGLPSAPAQPRFRPCCMLTPTQNPLGSSTSNLVDPGSLGTHGSSTEATGLIYSGKAGFLDLGHIRDTCDLTKSIFDQIAAACGNPTTVTAIEGSAQVRSVSPSKWIGVARAIAYDDALAHEIVSYSNMSPGGHNSSFSPEDLCSNFLGTLLAERAIASGGSFASAVTTELSSLVGSLDGQSVAESLKAFNLIKKLWVDFNGFSDILRNDYLKRRNFTQTPWKTGHASDSPAPAFVTGGFGSVGSLYSYTCTSASPAIPKSSFPAEIARIQADARTRYGPDFDKP